MVRPSISAFLSLRQLSFICLLAIGFFANAQNLKCRWIPGQVADFPLDTLIIEASSIDVSPNSSFTFNQSLQTISIDSDADSVLVCYRYLSPEVFGDIFIRDLAQYEPSEGPRTVPTTSDDSEYELFNFGSDLNKSGYISRGVTFGNRQNLFVNSTLNLQMQGKLSDNMNIEAVITDQNIPYQPEGNTQQIRDFDNVYIKLYNERFDLTAGDIVLTNPFEDSYFLKYYKNVQGLQVNYKGKFGRWDTKSHLAASAAKGKFASIQVDAIEGAQGPYQLRGPNNERFIIVLANSEKVFLDGKQLERGFDRDYVIDYNLGQITFNANILITQFSIIRVDFEYSEQYYTRTSTSVAQSLHQEKWDIRFNYYSEKDNNAGTLGFQPSSNDLAILQAIGDNVSQAQISGTDSVGFDLNRILYRKLDTLDLDGDQQEIFEYSTNPDSAFFEVSFNEVGFGNGDYVLLSTTSNGRIFQWISPQGGVSQGNFQPTRQVPLPISKRMMSMALEHRFNKFESLTQEIAFSNQDKNLYSDLDDEDNEGIAWMGRVKSEGREVGNGYIFKSQLQWEFDQSNFNRIDRYRPILFDRDWDYSPDEQTARDLIVWFSSGVTKSTNQTMSYQLMRRDRPGAIDGWQHSATLNQKAGDFYYRSEHFLLKNQQVDLMSDWVRTSNDISYRNWNVIPGYSFSLDQNTLSQGDSILSTRMHYVANEFYLTNSDSAKSRFRMSYQKRKDQIPMGGQLEDFTSADNYIGNYAREFGLHSVGLTGTYRRVRDKQNETTDEWFNARASWDGKFFKENVSHRMTYQVGNVRELKREFIYVLVGGNQGTHAWRDENGDGIKDLNEFYEAVNPDEQQYAKFFTPTDDFITAFETRYQHVIDLQFPRNWADNGFPAAFLSNWSGQVSINTNFKTTSEDASKRLNPFNIRSSSDEVIYAANRWRYTTYYNRNRNGLGWEGSFSKSERKQLLSNGFELSEFKDWISTVRWRFNQEYTVQVRNQWGRQNNLSDFLENRNVRIRSFGMGPEFIWQPSTSFRFIGTYQYRERQNVLSEEPEESKLNEIEGTVTWNQSNKGNLQASLRWLDIEFQGIENTYSAYQLLEALRPGKNTTWRLNWQQTLGKGIQMTLQYNGRTSEGQAPIHTGTVVMTAFF